MDGGMEGGGEHHHHHHHHHHRQASIAPSVIFLTVLAFHYASTWIDRYKKSGYDKDKDTKLRGEIKKLLKEASALSQPSTFAQAAKLRRVAAAKERELAKCQKLHNEDSASYSKILFITKVVKYLISSSGFGVFLWLSYLNNWCNHLEDYYLGGLEGFKITIL